MEYLVRIDNMILKNKRVEYFVRINQPNQGFFRKMV